ncbi:hypothetical protein G7Y89_g13828 [Cudoniella acicularis]|uniref:Uncharacterized protein n=1 Tax=Cudoniella acicularis TaxID=354080 RepID=A0A8H4VXV3_9HELO|nr:hypothetical protein G7Y89_g13828 [Cudoniella acicularis]
MVKLPLVQSANAAFVASQQPLVAVVVGGTFNIGAHTVKCLAATHGKTGNGLRLYILGRKAKAAEEIIAECQKLCPSGQFIFIQVTDLALLKNVDLVCTELVQREEKEAKAKGGIPKIDILLMTQGIARPWDPRNGWCIELPSLLLPQRRLCAKLL